MEIPCTPVSKIVYASMDGTVSLRALRERLGNSLPELRPEMIEQELQQIYAQLQSRGYVYLIGAGSYGVTVPDYQKLLADSRPGRS
jgi:hypothetical protein